MLHIIQSFIFLLLYTVCESGCTSSQVTFIIYVSKHVLAENALIAVTFIFRQKQMSQRGGLCTACFRHMLANS